MKTWRMSGSDAWAVAPRVTLLVGMVRQPRTGWPSSAAMLVKELLAFGALGRILRQETPCRRRIRRRRAA